MSGVTDKAVNIFEVSTNTLIETTVANIINPEIKQEVTTVLSNPRLVLNGRLIKIVL